jgi:signal transduction histidine kinase
MIPASDIRPALDDGLGTVERVYRRVRYQSLRAVRALGTGLGVPNALLTLYIEWRGGSLTGAVVLAAALQICTIGLAWLITEKSTRRGAAVLIGFMATIGIANIVIWGVNEGTALLTALVCVACAVFLGTREGRRAWIAASFALIAYIGWTYWTAISAVPASPAGALALIVRDVTAILAATGAMLAFVSAALEGLEGATAELASVLDRERALADLRFDEHARAMEERNRQQQFLDASQRVGHTGSWRLDLASRSFTGTPELVRLLGAAPQAFVPTLEAMLASVHADDRDAFRAWLTLVRDGSGPGGIEIRLPLSSGSMRLLSVEGDVDWSAAGDPVALIGTLQDVTDLRTKDALLRQAQKMEAVGLLAGGIAHDFGNLLTVIGGRAGVVRRELPENSPWRADLDAMMSAVRRANDLTRSLVAFSGKQERHPRLHDLNRVIGELQPLLSSIAGEGIEFVTDFDSDLRPVRMDRGQLEQVVLNLVANARSAMPHGGQLTIETRNLAASVPGNVPHSPEADCYVQLVVSDTGVGMSAATQARVFEPFFTTRAPGQGSGLGLAMVHGIITQSGGQISVSSEVGRGARFEIRLPDASHEASSERAANPVARV